jgi:hypothetical protein
MSFSSILQDMDKKLATEEKVQQLREEIVQLKKRRGELHTSEQELKAALVQGTGKLLSTLCVDRYRYSTHFYDLYPYCIM